MCLLLRSFKVSRLTKQLVQPVQGEYWRGGDGCLPAKGLMWGSALSSVVECLSGFHKALDLVPTTTNWEGSMHDCNLVSIILELGSLRQEDC